MKTTRYKRRFYRDWVGVKDLSKLRVAVKETDLEILTDKPQDKDFIKRKINLCRSQIDAYILRDERFLTSLKPIAVELNAPAIVKEMCKQAKKANVGPMATVAGAIAQFLGRCLLENGCREVIIENGGDIFLKINKTRKVGIYAGRLKAWQDLGLKVRPEDTPLGICCSSGTIGHSLSFGCADSVVILAKNAALADAVATATCNLVKSKSDLTKALNFARSIRPVVGAVIILKNNLAGFGKVEFIR